MPFLLGCNYWASHAGCHMWRQWNAATVRADLKLLHESGMTCLRVFPLWSDFQPVTPIYGGGGVVRTYRMADDVLPTNPWFLDEVMLQRFETLCDIAAEYNLKLIVGLLTGWMSGRLYIPPALNGRDLYSDAQALLWEQRFVEGFVTRLRHHPAIYAWDHGNECNCMWSTASRDTAAAWTKMLSNAIRAADATRPVISGVHDLSLEGVWHIDDQAECTDMLVTHPYPFWVRHANQHPLCSLKTLVHAAAQTAFYADLSGKPCLVEEIGTMGPMICSPDTAAAFLRLNIWHAHIFNRPGLLWWTAFDQPFNQPPYEEFAAERELGLFDLHKKPYAMMRELSAMAKRLQTAPRFPDRHVDAVCLLAKGIDSWKIAFATYLLAVQAGISISFADANRPLPEAKAYLLPCVNGASNMDKRFYDQLKARVRDGAKLYLSLGTGFLTEFEELTGLCIEDSSGSFTCQLTVEGQPIVGTGDRQLFYRNAENGLHRHEYGKGVVYTLDFSPEQHLFDDRSPETSPYYHIYRHVFQEERAAYPIQCNDTDVGIVWHEESGYCHILNYSNRDKIVAGHTVPAYDAVLIATEETL